MQNQIIIVKTDVHAVLKTKIWTYIKHWFG